MCFQRNGLVKARTSILHAYQIGVHLSISYRHEKTGWDLSPTGSLRNHCICTRMVNEAQIPSFREQDADKSGMSPDHPCSLTANVRSITCIAARVSLST